MQTQQAVGQAAVTADSLQFKSALPSRICIEGDQRLCGNGSGGFYWRACGICRHHGTERRPDSGRDCGATHTCAESHAHQERCLHGELALLMLCCFLASKEIAEKCGYGQ